MAARGDQRGIGQRLWSHRHREENAMTNVDLRHKNACLREQIAEAVEKDPELRERDEGLALRQDLHVEVGTPFLERTQGKLQERARAMINRHPNLDRYFEI
jgi:hypothetical protein